MELFRSHGRACVDVMPHPTNLGAFGSAIIRSRLKILKFFRWIKRTNICNFSPHVRSGSWILESNDSKFIFTLYLNVTTEVKNYKFCSVDRLDANNSLAEARILTTTI